MLSSLQQSDLVVLGEGADLFVEKVPGGIEGKTLAESGIGAQTGLNVIAVRVDGQSVTNPPANEELARGGELVMLGTVGQHQQFVKVFGQS